MVFKEAFVTKNSALNIKTIEPTVFFIEEKKKLLQAADISINNTGKPLKASMDVRIGLQKKRTDIGMVKHGKGKYRIYVPDVREITDAEFTLSASGRVQDRQMITWTPQKHWQVYLAHYSHHDLGYTDLPTDILQEYDGFYDKVLRFCEETEDWPDESKFRYVIEQSWSVKHFIENRPKETVDKLIKYMKEGRIELTALFGNQTTELCGHEELIRLMYPSFNLKREHGIKIRSAGLNDIPGLSWGLATVLPGAGVKYFTAGIPAWYFRQDKRKVHPFWDEKKVLSLDIPGALCWKGIDGAQMLFCYNIHGIDELYLWNYAEALGEITNTLSLLEKQNYPFNFVLYTVRGGERDNAPPSLHLSHTVREWNNKWTYPRLRTAIYPDFFERLEKYKNTLPVFRGELPNTDYTVAATCTAKETGINRNTHDQLSSAEKFATIASIISDYSYPLKEINDAYTNTFYYDLHCHGMPGSIGPAQDACLSEKKNFAYRAAALSHDILLKSLNKIVDEIEIKDDDYHIIVFNSLSRKRIDVVRIPFSVYLPCNQPMHVRYQNGTSAIIAGSVIGRNIINPPIDLVEKPFDLIDTETGETVSYQVVKHNSPKAPVPYAASRYALGQFNRAELFEIVFVAEDVSVVGYKTYRLVPKEKATSFESSIAVGERSLENRYFKITLNSQTGTMESIYDKELSREIVDKDAPHKLNQLIVRRAKTGKEENLQKATIRKGESGPVYGSLIVSSQNTGCPQVTQEIILYDKIKRIDIFNRVLRDSTPLLEVYFAFPFLMNNPHFQFEGSNSVIEPLKDQFPGSNSDYYTMQHWADVSNEKIGITLSSIEAPIIEFGGLWSGYVSYAHHGVTPPGFGHEFKKSGEFTKGYMYSYIMNNNFRTNFENIQVTDTLFRYSITTHQGNWKQGQAHDFGWAISNPLIPICINGKKKGKLKKSISFCQVDKANVLLSTLKKAEDGNGIIIRLIETEGKNTTTTLTLPFISITQVYQTNLVEENERLLSAQKHEVTAPIKAFGITTIRVKVL